jgi:hypothetical protein
MCTGSCELELPEGGVCEGTCSGECTVASQDGRCEGASSASCRGAPNALVPCSGHCEGELHTPPAKVECDAVVQAEAALSVRCTPPRVAVDYRLSSDLDPQASARFALGMQMLQERLPALLATLARAKKTAGAGAGLVSVASAAVEAAVTSFLGDSDLRVQFGLRCALREAALIPDAVAPTGKRLTNAMVETVGVTRVLGLP